MRNSMGLAVIGVLTSVVGAYYYLRVVKLMYFDAPAGLGRSDEPRRRDRDRRHRHADRLVLAWPAPVLSGAAHAAAALFGG